MRVKKSAVAQGLRLWLAFRAVAGVGLGCLVAMSASAATLDRIRESGHLRLGYVANARPFSFRSDSGADGYAVALCQRVAETVKAQSGATGLVVDWVPVEGADRLSPVEEGGIDLLCVPTSVTLEHRQHVSFSLPIYAGGLRAVVREDASADLRRALGEEPIHRPVWRGSPAAKLLNKTSFAVVSGTTSESLLQRRLDELQLDAKVVPVPDYQEGVRQLLDRKVDVLFGDPSVVLAALDPGSVDKVAILDRRLTHEPVALALARNDDDFRLLVDRALSELYLSGDFQTLYRKWFGAFDEPTRLFFLWNTPVQ